LEVGKNVPLGQAEPLSWASPRGSRSRSLQPRSDGNGRSSNQRLEWKEFSGVDGETRTVGDEIRTLVPKGEANLVAGD
jgi:hypothetical protein